MTQSSETFLDRVKRASELSTSGKVAIDVRDVKLVLLECATWRERATRKITKELGL